MLFAAFPKADEGELSRRLADLVRRETCADVARAVDLGDVVAARRIRGADRRPLARRDPGRCLRVADRRDLPRRRLQGGARIRRAVLGRADAKAGAAAARSQNRAAGMGAGARAADAVLSRSRAHRPASRSRIPRRGEPAAIASRPKARGAPSARPSRPRRRPCCRARACAPMADGARRRHALRLCRADRRAQCRQVDAHQRAGRLESVDRLAQGADHAHAGARHRDRGRSRN